MLALQKAVWHFLGKMGNDLPQDSDIPLLGICPKKSISYYRDICSSIFISSLFIVTRNCKQPRCLLMHRKCRTLTQQNYSTVNQMKSGNLKVHGQNQRKLPCVRQPRNKKTYILCIHLYIDASIQVFDKQTIIHMITETG